MSDKAETNSTEARDHYQVLFRNMSPAEKENWKEEFSAKGMVVFDNLLLPTAFDTIRAETLRLLEFAKRKDIQIESNGISERKMSTIGGNLIKDESVMFRGLYLNGEVFAIIQEIAGEKPYPVLDKNEDIVVNCLHKKSDAHGRHIDTYSFAFNIMISSPPPNTGGELAIYSEGKSQLYNVNAGSCYLIRTDRYEHEVLNLTADVQRLVVNMSYANNDTKDLYSYSSSLLYS